VDSEASSTIG